MATSTAVLLLPEETDDKAPPTACRIRESISQGYGKISESVLPIDRWWNMPASNSCLKVGKEDRGTYNENPVVELWCEPCMLRTEKNDTVTCKYELGGLFVRWKLHFRQSQVDGC